MEHVLITEQMVRKHYLLTCSPYEQFLITCQQLEKSTVPVNNCFSLLAFPVYKLSLLNLPHRLQIQQPSLVTFSNLVFIVLSFVSDWTTPREK